MLFILLLITTISACPHHSGVTLGVTHTRNGEKLFESELFYKNYQCSTINYLIENITNSNNTVAFYKFNNNEPFIVCQKKCSFELNCNEIMSLNVDDRKISWIVDSNNYFSYEIEIVYPMCEIDLTFLIPIIIIPTVVLICVFYHGVQAMCGRKTNQENMHEFTV